MFKVSAILFLSMLSFKNSKAQSFPGTYRLHGIHDAAGEFTFTADGHFTFGFIYGASDRFANGTYIIANDTVKLQSDKKPGEDFTINIHQRKGNDYTIKITAPNEQLVQGVSCIYFIGDETYEAKPGADGIITVPYSKVDTIYLQHLYFPDVPTIVKDENNSNNYFEVSLNKSLLEVSFKGIDLFIKEDTLTWLPNYFLPEEGVKFIKEE